MSEQPNPYPHKPPFKTLGKYLKTMRQKQHESLGETSGAVEIEVEKLDRYERGVEAPTEDILLLLISHFGLQEEEAIELWELAGYDRNGQDSPFNNNDDRERERPEPIRPMQVTLVALDNRVLYSNSAEVVTDESGVVINFMQSAEAGHQPYVISRIGMSTEQAERLLEVLQRSLLHKKYMAGPKALPHPKSDKPKEKS